MPLRRMQHYPVFSVHHELRAGESEAMLHKEKPSFSIVLRVCHQFFGRRSSTLTMLPGARCGNAWTSSSPTLA